MGRIKVKDEKKGMTNAKERFDITQRVSNLEQMSAKMVESVNNSFQQLAQDNVSVANHLHDFDMVLQAMMEVLDGTEKKFSGSVAEVVKRLKIAELETKAEKEIAELKVMEAEGKIVKADTITCDNDFVVTTTKDDKGQQLYPSKSPMIVGRFIPAIKELIITKKVGETITLPNGNVLEILEVYKLPEPSPDEYKESSDESSDAQQESSDTQQESSDSTLASVD